ncbi:tricalbin, partial [Hortaea werneckii]
MKKALEAGEKEQTEAEEVKTAPVPKVRIGPEDLKNYESGLLVFRILEGHLAHSGTYLEVVMDDNLFPVYTSAKAKSGNYNFNETGDFMVRELDLSRITLRLVSELDTKGEGMDKDHIKAKLTGQTLDTLKRCLYTPTQISLKDEHGRESKITVSMRFLPVKMELDPSESFNNSGNLRVEVLDAADLPAADRNGYSDPYCKFIMNDKEVYKTKTQKKTLHPAWNEFFEIPVRSRTASKFVVEVFDWDFGDRADPLGNAAINLDVLEPFQPQEVVLGLDGKSGSIRLKMLFKPEYVTRMRQGSSTFSGTFAVPGKVLGAPVKGVGKGATFLGGNVAKGASFLGRGFKRRTVSGQAEDVDGDATVGEIKPTSMDIPESGSVGGANGYAAVPSIEGPSGTPHSRQRSFGGQSARPATATTGTAEPGTASITVVSASGFEADQKLEVHVSQDSSKGPKKLIETDHHKPVDGVVQYQGGPKRVQCAADSQFRVEVRDHGLFGGEKLGEAPFFINDQSTGGQQEVRVGAGVVTLSTSFQPAEAGSMLSPESPASR